MKHYPLFEHWYKTTDWILDRCDKMPKHTRFTINDRISNLAIDTVELLTEAVYSNEKIELLRRHEWFLKTEVEKFFDSVDHDVLLELLNRKIKDQKLLEVTEIIIRHGGDAGKGLPIGNCTSQFFANVYLNSLDHFIKEKLHLPACLRYMDLPIQGEMSGRAFSKDLARSGAFLSSRDVLHRS